eukprot:15088388-Ditylum_brightwellii.AAC.1
MRRLFQKRVFDPIQLTRDTKRVKVVFGDEEVTFDMTKRIGRKAMLQNDLNDWIKKCRESFRELTMLERQKWIDGLAREVLCNFLDKGEYNTDGVGYIEHNVKIATDVMNLVSALEERLQ